jgi:prepilin-type N-terminal cleavage/methylation domain-containing protein
MILRHGFTLLELLVVIAIIGILSTIILAALNGARGNAYETKVAQTLDSANKAIEIYRLQNGHIPFGNFAGDDLGASDLYKIGECKNGMSFVNSPTPLTSIDNEIRDLIAVENLNLDNGCILYLIPTHSYGVEECLDEPAANATFCSYEYLLLHLPYEIGDEIDFNNENFECVFAYSPADDSLKYSDYGYICLPSRN